MIDKEVTVKFCTNTRSALKAIEQQVRAQKGLILDNTRLGKNKGEVLAQITLALRHIEDARMRLGKTIQYSDDSISCYDK